MDAGLCEDLARALDGVQGIEALACDGDGHAIPGATACIHVRCSLPSPEREGLLGRVGALVRRSKYVFAALVDRRDLYSISFTPDKRNTDAEAAARKLIALLEDPAALGSDHVPDRRGR